MRICMLIKIILKVLKMKIDHCFDNLLVPFEIVGFYFFGLIKEIVHSLKQMFYGNHFESNLRNENQLKLTKETIFQL